MICCIVDGVKYGSIMVDGGIKKPHTLSGCGFIIILNFFKKSYFLGMS